MNDMTARGLPQEGSILPSRRDAILGTMMVAAGAIAYARLPRRTAILIGPGQLDKIVPLHIGPWTFQTASGLVQPPPDALVDQLYNQQVSRYYGSDSALPVMLSMAYGNSQGGTLQVHRPEICYPASGFRLTDTETRELPITPKLAIPARSFTATSESRTEQVLYWTRIGGIMPTSWSGQRIAIMRNNIAGTIPDGLLVRVSTLTPDPARAFQTLTTFVQQMLAAAGPKGRGMLLGRPDTIV